MSLEFQHSFCFLKLSRHFLYKHNECLLNEAYYSYIKVTLFRLGVPGGIIAQGICRYSNNVEKHKIW